MGRPLRRVPGLGQRRRGGGAAGAARAGRAGDHAGGADRQVPVEDSHARTSGVAELDRVLGGGLVPGAVSCWPASPASASPRCCSRWPPRPPASGHRTLYVTGEESAAQVRLRADRTGGVHDELYLAAETDLGAVLGHVEAGPAPAAGRRLGADHRRRRRRRRPRRRDPGPGGRGRADPGGQDPQHGHRAGRPRDQGRQRSPARGCSSTSSTWCCTSRATGTRGCGMVRAVKNRFGPADEVGCFDLSEDGIDAVTDPTGLFVDAAPRAGARHLRHGDAGGPPAAAGRGAGAGAPAPAERPRRTTSGLDGSRVAMVLAVLQQHGPDPAARPRRVRLHRRRRPADRAAPPTSRSRSRSPRRRRRPRRSAATWSRSARSAWPARSAGCRDLPQRLAEAARLGFRRAIVPGRARAAAARQQPHRRRHAGDRGRPTSTPRCGCSSWWSNPRPRDRARCRTRRAGEAGAGPRVGNPSWTTGALP